MKNAQILTVTVKANNFSGKYVICLCKNWIRSESHNTDLRLRGAQAESNIHGSATLTYFITWILGS